MKTINEIYGAIRLPELNITIDLDGNEFTVLETAKQLSLAALLALVKGKQVKMETGDIGVQANIYVTFNDGSSKVFGVPESEWGFDCEDDKWIKEIDKELTKFFATAN